MGTRANSLELIITGSELLDGRVIDLHTRKLAHHLETTGWQISRSTTVSDDKSIIEAAVTEALNRSGLVIISGGLGPTSDDLTLSAVASSINRNLIIDKKVLKHIHEFCSTQNLSQTEARNKQAFVIDKAVVLCNPIGTAPGELIEIDGKYIILLPGPPDEFEAILSISVIPWLKKKRPFQLAQKVFMICGLGESDIALRIMSDLSLYEQIGVSYRAACAKGVEIRLYSSTEKSNELEELSRKIKYVLRDYIFAEELISMEEVVGRLLRKNHTTLATAESCTGGLLGNLITNVSGSSDYYVGGIVAYSNNLKISELGVDEEIILLKGAVSEEVAEQMARGVRGRFKTDYGIAITGIAGPNGGTPKKPIGLVYISVSDKNQTLTKKFDFGSNRIRVKQMSCFMALDMLRRVILSRPYENQ